MWWVLGAFLLMNLAKGINMNAIWSTIGMAQLIANMKNMTAFQMPAPSFLTMTQLNMMVSFSPNDYPVINEWIQGHFAVVSTFLETQSMMLLGLIGLGAVVVLLLLLKLLTSFSPTMKEFL